MAECVTSSSESFGTPGSPPSTPSDDTTKSTTSNNQGYQNLGPKKSRRNTVQEKRAMRRERKKKRKMKKSRLAKDLVRDMRLYKIMARDYWDRWQWEMQKRKEEMRLRTIAPRHASNSLHEIDPSQLSDPIQDGRPTEVYLGRGSFSVVRLNPSTGEFISGKK